MAEGFGQTGNATISDVISDYNTVVNNLATQLNKNGTETPASITQAVQTLRGELRKIELTDGARPINSDHALNKIKEAYAKLSTTVNADKSISEEYKAGFNSFMAEEEANLPVVESYNEAAADKEHENSPLNKGEDKPLWQRPAEMEQPTLTPKKSKWQEVQDFDPTTVAAKPLSIGEVKEILNFKGDGFKDAIADANRALGKTASDSTTAKELAQSVGTLESKINVVQDSIRRETIEAVYGIENGSHQDGLSNKQKRVINDLLEGNPYYSSLEAIRTDLRERKMDISESVPSLEARETNYAKLKDTLIKGANAAESAVRKTADITAKFINDVAPAVQGTIKVTAESVTKVLDSAGENAPKIGAAGEQIVIAGANGVVQVVDAAGEAAKKAGDATAKVIEAGAKGTSDVIKATGDAAPKVGKAAGEFVKETTPVMVDGVVKLTPAAVSIIGAVKDTGSTQLEVIFDGTAKIIEKTGEAISKHEEAKKAEIKGGDKSAAIMNDLIQNGGLKLADASKLPLQTGKDTSEKGRMA